MRFIRSLSIARVATMRDRCIGDEVANSSPPNTHNQPKFLRTNDSRIANMTKFFTGAALAALIGNPALAADMPVKAPPTPAFGWEGLYIGGNVGWLGIEGVSLSGTPADSATL